MIKKISNNKLWIIIGGVFCVLIIGFFITISLLGGSNGDVERIAKEMGVSVEAVEESIKESGLSEEQFVKQYDAFNDLAEGVDEIFDEDEN